MNIPASSWLGLARRLSRKVNFAFSLDHAAVPMVVAAGVAAGVLLMVRHHWPDASHKWIIFASAMLPVAATGWAWWHARKRFIGIDEALVRLEVRLGLHAALSTARAGEGAWPPVPAVVDDGLHWRWSRAGLPPLLAAALVASAWLMPVTARQTPAEVSEPASWSVVEADLQTLVNERVVDETSTENARQAIQALRERPQGEWFNHASIEAGDRILLAHQREMAALEAKMREAARALRDAMAPRPGNPNHQPALDPALNEMLQGLRTGGLRPDAGLMEKLSELADENGSALNQIDPRQLAELLERMRENARMLAEMRGRFQGMPELAGESDGDMIALLAEGDDGRGFPTRGPGEGGPLFGNENDEIDASRDKPLPAGDLTRAAPGDMLGETEATHEMDEATSPALRAGGSPVRPGDGGGAVWSDNLHPDEQQALRRFFE